MQPPYYNGPRRLTGDDAIVGIRCCLCQRPLETHQFPAFVPWDTCLDTAVRVRDRIEETWRPAHAGCAAYHYFKADRDERARERAA